ncbi:hypothetical protein DCE94_03860 [Agromyces badenianii]|nr:hypothetical protein DCE94_03860 [Agromyces badenianii]
MTPAEVSAVRPERRRRLEALIRVTDLIVYVAVLAGGVYALFFTPTTVAAELAGWKWLVPIWAGLLLLGGLLGFIGRLTRYWVIELPATTAAVFGTLIYAVILSSSALQSITSTVAATLVVVAMLGMLRRYIELQIFATEPGESPFRDRLTAMIRRRTGNVAPRHE